MKIILLQDVAKVGQRGSVASVARGYAHNVLFPKKLAIPATKKNMERHEKAGERQKDLHALNAELAAKALADIDGRELGIQTRANEQETLFESIHPKQVAEAIEKELGLTVSEEAIVIAEGPIKKLGSHRAQIFLHGASAELSIVVSKI